MSAICPACRAPASPGATRCSRCNAFLDGLPAAAPGIAQTTFGAPADPASSQAAYGAPPQQGYGAPPQQGYGAPPQPPQGGYGAPPQPAQGGYGAPPQPAQGGYGAPPQQGYGAPPQPAQGGYGGPPQQGYGAPPQPSQGGYGAPPQQGYGQPGAPMGAPAAYGAPPAPGYGAAAPMGYGAAPAYPAPKAGMSGCGVAAIVGVVIALLGGLGLVLLVVIAGAAAANDSSASNPAPVVDGPGIPDDTGHDDVPDTGALTSLLKDRVGAYRLGTVGEVTNLGSALQGGIVDSKGAEYIAPDGTKVTLLMLAYASESIAQSKISVVESVLRGEPGQVVARSQVLNKQRRVVGTRVRATGLNPQRVYWTNGKLLAFTTAAPPHAVGFEMAAPF